jgi:outer membrane immunogenic protein
MKKILIATAAAIAVASGAASAADMSMPLKARPAPAPVYTWTGCYLDAGGGGGFWNQSHYGETPAGAPVTGEQSAGGRGWYGEVGGGCDYQFSLNGMGNFVIGVLGGYDFMSLKGAYTETALGPVNGYEKESGSAFVGGRLGYLVTPNLLTYVSGGWTNERIGSFGLAPLGGPVVDVVSSHTYSGYFIGGGAETSLSPWLPQGFFLRSDYKVSTYRPADIAYLTPAGVPIGLSTHMNNYVQQIGTELIYRFNFH